VETGANHRHFQRDDGENIRQVEEILDD